jgi:two-component system, NarL family, nitrate/nitrite response regulator NarL
MATHEAHSKSGGIGVLVVADVRLYREGLADSLGCRERLAVLGTSATRANALASIAALHPDVVIIDTAMRESLDLIRELRAQHAAVKILAFAVDETTSDVLDCAEAGATGYVTADASVDELALAVERIAREELVCSPRVTAQLFGRMSRNSSGPPSALSQLQGLTIRERQVLELIREGYSNKEISQRLNIAEPTVKNHVHHLLAKLDVRTRGHAAARATLRATRRRYEDDDQREIS